jgi:DNA-binding transcriptional MocR family regulator
MKNHKELLYQEISNAIELQIKQNVLKVGDKLPSLRSICYEHDVSMNTAQQSYFTLESKGLIESRPQSGYFVAYSPDKFLDTPSTSNPLLTHGLEDIEDIIDTISKNKSQTKINFSQGAPDLALLPVAKLNKAMMHAIRELPDSGITYNHAGSERLKLQIAKRSMQWGGKLKSADIILTSGCMEALAFCMMAVAQKGDTIAVESPVFYGILQLAKSLGLNVLELPTNATTGIEIPALENALKKKKVKVCLLISNFSNPLGSCMPDEHKKEVVRLMEKYNVPLIEDDLYGDLYFGSTRPKNCKTYDESGIVMWCGSFSKTLTTGYRVGWVSGGKYSEKILRLKKYFSIASNSLAQEAIGYFLENERYENHLRKLRNTLHTNCLQSLRCISEYFPSYTKVSHPQGGFFLWIELTKKARALELYDKAIKHKISIAPGNMYTLQKQYQNCFRLSYGLSWNDKTEQALKFLGNSVKG